MWNAVHSFLLTKRRGWCVSQRKSVQHYRYSYFARGVIIFITIWCCCHLCLKYIFTPSYVRARTITITHTPAGNWQNNGNTKRKRLNGSQQLQRTLASILQMSGTLLEGSDTLLPRVILYVGVLFIVVENVVSGAAPESTLSVQLDWNLVTETTMAYSLHCFQAHQNIQWPLVPCGWGHSHPMGA